MKRDEIKQLFPSVFERTIKDGNPLSGLLDVMEGLHAHSEAVLQRLDSFFDPLRTTDEFVPYLAYWADLNRLFVATTKPKEQLALSGSTIASGLGRLRELIANAAYLSQWRGTMKGLLLFLQIATGFQDFDIRENVDSGGQPRPFHLSIRAPKDSEQYDRLIVRIIELEKPAYVTYELSFAQMS